MISELKLYQEIEKKLNNIDLITMIYIPLLTFFLLGTGEYILLTLLIPYIVIIYKYNRFKTRFTKATKTDLTESADFFISKIYSKNTVFYAQLFDSIVPIILIIFLKITSVVSQFIAISILIISIAYIFSVNIYFEHREKTNELLTNMQNENKLFTEDIAEQLLFLINNEVEYIWKSRLYFYLGIIITFILNIFNMSNYYR